MREVARTTTDDEFFQQKRLWSGLKDRILGTYIVPYLRKVATLHRPIVLVDAFAGPGVFKDGSKGSPLILTEAAERLVPDQYVAYFVNHKRAHHETLEANLARLIAAGKVQCFNMRAAEFLPLLRKRLSVETLLLYLDPFGLKGCEFTVIKPFLTRPRVYSTEILVNVSVSTIHRLAASRARAKGEPNSHAAALNDRLTSVMDGTHWQPIFDDSDLTAQQRTERVVAGYRERLREFLPYVESCPVRESPRASVKYYMTFCSRSPDAFELMNDAMCQAYHERMHESVTSGTLFEGTDWREDRHLGELEKLIEAGLTKLGPLSRKQLWFEIIHQRFMSFTASEYKAVVRALVEGHKLSFRDTRGTGRLNDDSVIYFASSASKRGGPQDPEPLKNAG